MRANGPPLNSILGFSEMLYTILVRQEHFIPQSTRFLFCVDLCEQLLLILSDKLKYYECFPHHYRYDATLSVFAFKIEVKNLFALFKFEINIFVASL